MEYIYAAMLLHKAGHKVEEANVTKVLEAAGVKADHARVKAVVAALDGVDIDKAIKDAALPIAVAATAPAAGPGDKKEEKKKEEKSEEDREAEEAKATAGLGALFG